MDLERKLAILADAAKYDASCASSGTSQARLARRQGHRLDRRLGHLPQLRARRPLHLAAEDPAHQLLHLRLPLLRQPRVEQRRRARASRSTRWCSSRSTSIAATASRACSSARASSARPTTRWSRWSRSRGVLREEHDFRGYIHLKTIPDASAELLAARRPLRRSAQHQHRAADGAVAGRAGAREGRRGDPAARWRACALHIDDAQGAARPKPVARSRCSAPQRGRAAALRAGRPEHADDRRRRRHRATRTILATSADALRRLPPEARLLLGLQPDPRCLARAAAAAPPLVREHRLYQADWLMRFYGFAHERDRAGRRRHAVARDRSQARLGAAPIASASRST